MTEADVDVVLGCNLKAGTMFFGSRPVFAALEASGEGAWS